MIKILLLVFSLLQASNLAIQDQVSAHYPVSEMYGTGGAAWGIANTAITDGVVFSQTFIPSATANLTGFRGYLEDEDGGYGAGTGGIIHFEVQTDINGFASGTQVGRGYAEAVHPRPNNLIFELHEFNPPVPVRAGTKYHLVVRNLHPNPDDNYISMNDVYQGTGPLTVNSCNVKYGTKPWRKRENKGFHYVPIGEYHYDNGVVDGFGYVHAMTHDQHKRPISSIQGVRQLFTVSGGDKLIGDLHFYAEHLDGNATSMIAILRSNGTEKTQSATRVSPKDNRDGRWFIFPFKEVLRNGVSYQLEIFAEGAAGYSALIFRNGKSFGYSPQSEFSDGHAQFKDSFDSDWEDWVIWGDVSDEGDLMFYFEVE